jgi:hypothetical protein
MSIAVAICPHCLRGDLHVRPEGRAHRRARSACRGCHPDARRCCRDLAAYGDTQQVTLSRPTIRSRQDVMDDGTRTVVEHTDGSQTLGLLQTEEYERAAIAAARPAPSTEELEQTVALRMTRQQILELDGDLPLDQEPTPRLWAIIDESALHRIAGSPQVMQAQRDHLVKMAQQPNVTIQVMPFSQGLTCAYGRSFTILTSRSGSGRSCRGCPERSLSP